MDIDQKAQLRRLLSSTSALLEAMRYSASTASGEAANVGRYAGYITFMRKYNELVKVALPLLSNTSVLDLFDISRVKTEWDTTWVDQKAYFDGVYSNTALLKSLIEGAIGYAEDEARNLNDFLRASLRRTLFKPPNREIEVQNAVEVLFVGRGMEKGIDYDRETGRVKTSGKESVPDFTIPRLKLCVEVKLLKSAGDQKAIVDEINADIRAYGSFYERQLYLVYDLGFIRDESEFRRDLEDAPGVSVLIIKH